MGDADLRLRDWEIKKLGNLETGRLRDWEIEIEAMSKVIVSNLSKAQLTEGLLLVSKTDSLQ